MKIIRGYSVHGDKNEPNDEFRTHGKWCVAEEKRFAKIDVLAAVKSYIWRMSGLCSNGVINGYCYAGINTIADFLDVDREAVKYAVKKLVDAGFVYKFNAKRLANNNRSKAWLYDTVTYYFPINADGTSAYGISIPMLDQNDIKHIEVIQQDYIDGKITQAEGNIELEKIYNIFFNTILNRDTHKVALKEEDSKEITKIYANKKSELEHARNEYGIYNPAYKAAKKAIITAKNNEIARIYAKINSDNYYVNGDIDVKDKNEKLSDIEKKLSTVDNTGRNFKAKKEYTEEYVINWFNSQIYHWKYPTDTTAGIYTKMVKGKKFTEDGIIKVLTSCINLNNKKSTLKKVELTEADLNELKELQNFEY